MTNKVNQAVFHKSALKEIQSFPQDVKTEVGEFIMALEMNLDVSDFDTKPMKTVASGAYEFRTYDKDKNYRVFYYLKVSDSILVFHAFTKKTRKTSEVDKKTALARLNETIESLKGGGKK